MTEDDEFKLLEQRLKQKGKTMYRPLEDKFPSTLAEIIEEDEQRAMNEHQVKVANARLSANEKQVGGVHYKAMGVEPWDVIDTWPLEQRIGFYRGNALKYIMVPPTNNGIRPTAVISAISISASRRKSAAE